MLPSSVSLSAMFMPFRHGATLGGGIHLPYLRIS